METKKIKSSSSLREAFGKRFLRGLVVLAMLAVLIPSNVAGADFAVDDETGLVTVPLSVGLTSYFYRLPLGIDGDDSEFAYGYGYAYLNGTVSYGYGYGYGYAFFSENADAWTAGDSRLGFFIGTSGSTSTGATLPVTGLGVATVAVDMALAASGLSGVTVNLPAGLTLTGSPGWDGELAVTGTDTYSSTSSAIQALLDSGSAIASVIIATGLSTDVTLNKVVIVGLPLATTSPTIVMTTGSGTTSTLSACGTSYTGATTSVSALTNSDNYSVSAGSACYVVGTGSAAGTVYVATMHLSTFAGGSATVAAAAAADTGGSLLGVGGTSGSSSSSSSSSDSDGDDDSTGEASDDGGDEKSDSGSTAPKEKGPASVADFSDISGLDSSDWRYEVVEKVASTGLFQGETDKDGKKYFNMEGGMNRAMAATVIARYIGCETEVAPKSEPFGDVAVGEWYAPSVACLKENGVVTGKTHVSPPIFDPAANVTRAEFLKMMIEGYIVNSPTIETAWRLVMMSSSDVFDDVSGDEWFAGYLNLAHEYGLLEGYSEGGLKLAKGNKTIIRIEAAAIVSNFLDEVDVAAIGDPSGLMPTDGTDDIDPAAIGDGGGL